jgi:Aminotransferase class-III
MIGDVRGRGLMIGAEIVDPSAAPDELAPGRRRFLAAGLRAAALRHGLLVELGGRDDTVLRLLPPLTLTDAEAALVLDRLAAACAEVCAECAGEPRSLGRSWPAVWTGRTRVASLVGVGVLLDDLGLLRPRLCELVRTVVQAYRTRFDLPPDAYDEFERMAPDVEGVCLNREHLAGEGFGRVDYDEEFDIRFGRVPIPLCGPDPAGVW